MDNLDKYYNVFQTLPYNRKLFYISIIFFVYVISTRLWVGLNHIFALFIVILIIQWFMSGDIDTMNKVHTDISEKMNFVNSLLYTNSYDTMNDEFYIRPPIYGTYLNKDQSIVDFYYRLRDYANYNLPSFRKSLLNSNNLLGIETFINQLDYCNKKPKQWLQFAETEYKEALNNLHSLIYSLPSTRITNYTFNNSLNNLEHLLIQHLDNIKNLVKLSFDNSEINSDTDIVHDYHAKDDNTVDPGYGDNYSVY